MEETASDKNISVKEGSQLASYLFLATEFGRLAILVYWYENPSGYVCDRLT